eukprot:TRINITY_DN47022_c0_g1_i1.p1 TRINITY_DN47022_c0_g1~~TRINITY_DN47022_c0_g1_i1.p1  ORF type:complete len:808 (+),score=175.77 TRINITY_DN47022_c0_g1_i1:312-2426(+)
MLPAGGAAARLLSGAGTRSASPAGLPPRTPTPLQEGLRWARDAPDALSSVTGPTPQPWPEAPPRRSASRASARSPSPVGRTPYSARSPRCLSPSPPGSAAPPGLDAVVQRELAVHATSLGAAAVRRQGLGWEEHEERQMVTWHEDARRMGLCRWCQAEAAWVKRVQAEVAMLEVAPQFIAPTAARAATHTEMDDALMQVRPPSGSELCENFSAASRPQSATPHPSSESWLRYDMMYLEQAAGEAGSTARDPTPREREAARFWARDVWERSQQPEPGRLAQMLREDLALRKFNTAVRGLVAEEAKQRAFHNELAAFVRTGVVNVLQNALSETAQADVLALCAAEQEARGRLATDEAGGRIMLGSFWTVEELLEDEFYQRHNIFEEEAGLREHMASEEAVVRPEAARQHFGCSTSGGPICTRCGLTLSGHRFCAENGEPHAMRGVCDICGYTRLGCKYCPATGEPHERLIAASSPTRGGENPNADWAAEALKSRPPQRLLGATLGVRPLRADLLEALRKGDDVPEDQWGATLRGMVAPKMVMDLCRMLHTDHNVPLRQCDSVYVDALQRLGLERKDIDVLPSTVQHIESEESSDDAKSYASRAYSKASGRSSQRDSDRGKRAKRSKKQGAQPSASPKTGTQTPTRQTSEPIVDDATRRQSRGVPTAASMRKSVATLGPSGAGGAGAGKLDMLRKAVQRLRTNERVT